MGLEERYQLLEKIGTGSYATVFRARDLELGREVAIRQIHDKYLQNPTQLDRYWQEAQLLASLQHPNIVTTFDIHRERGWLILELMQSNLKERTAGRQMDLKSLRTAIGHSLRALKYLHAQGIVHGDIKPSNLMLDARRRVKLGDFGLARRASDVDGELIKGTTKYMAPETVSDDFGEIGPASDLYSLGFTAYELMCGENFDSLFPGLKAFGSNEQIAWMMWQAAPDRKLPQISRVLEGVPDDLTFVIQKLCEKDQSKRFRSADEAIGALNIDANLTGVRQIVSGQSASDEFDAGGQRTPEDKKRLMIIVAVFAMSMLMSIAMLFMGGDKPADTPGNAPPETVGIVRDVLPEQNRIVLLNVESGAAVEEEIGNAPVIYYRNEEINILLREIQRGDRVVVEKKPVAGNKFQYSLLVDRAEVSYGRLLARNPQDKRITLNIEEGPERGELSLRVPDRARIRINSQSKSLADLQEGDQMQVTHFPELGERAGRVVHEMVALREEEMTGYVSAIENGERTVFSISFGRGASSGTPQKLPLAKQCRIELQTPSGATQPIDVGDVQLDDRVKIKHDVEILSIIVTREESKIDGVIQQVDANSVTVSTDDGRQLRFSFSERLDVTINLEAARRDDLRRFDTAIVAYDETSGSPTAISIDARRPARADRWALIIANESYNDRTLTPAKNAIRDARLLRDTLIKRYAFNSDRILLLVDEPKARILQEQKQFLTQVRRETQLIVFVAGHAYHTDDGNQFLAVRDTNSDNLATTGLSLLEIAQPIEATTSKDKMLLLELCSETGGRDLQNQSSTGEAGAWLAATLKTTPVITSCGSDQKSLETSSGDGGVFASCIASGFAGAADLDKNIEVTPRELFEHLAQCVPIVVPAGKTQTPRLFLPGQSPE